MTLCRHRAMASKRIPFERSLSLVISGSQITTVVLVSTYVNADRNVWVASAYVENWINCQTYPFSRIMNVYADNYPSDNDWRNNEY